MEQGGANFPLPDDVPDPAEQPMEYLRAITMMQAQQVGSLVQVVNQNAQASAQLAQALQNQTNQPRPRRANLKLPCFSNEPSEDVDFLVWRQRFTRICAANGYDDDAAKHSVIGCMKKRAALSCGRINVDLYATCEALLNHMEGKFLPEANTPLAQINFERAQQRSDEDMATFHARLENLYQRAFPRDQHYEVSDQLHRQFIRGVSNPRVRDYVIWAKNSGNATNYGQLLLSAQHESARILQNQLYNTGGTAVIPGNNESEPMELGAMKKKTRPPSDKPTGKETSQERRKCAFCGKTNHWESNCFQLKKYKLLMKTFGKAKGGKDDPKGGDRKARQAKILAAIQQGNVDPPDDDPQGTDATSAMINAMVAGISFEDSDDSDGHLAEEGDDDDGPEAQLAAMHQALN